MLSTPCPNCAQLCPLTAETCPECGLALAPRPAAAEPAPAAESRLFPCPDCGHACSRSALSCPSCGRPFAPAARETGAAGGGPSRAFAAPAFAAPPPRGARGKVLAALVALLVAGAAAGLYFRLRPPREAAVTGDVFIVTKGAQNYKLGLVEVAAIPEEKMRGFIEQKRAAVGAAAGKYKAELDATQQEIARAQQDYDALKAAHDAALARQAQAAEQAQQLAAEAYVASEGSYSDSPADVAESAQALKVQQRAERAGRQAAGAARQVADARTKMEAKGRELDGARSRIWRLRGEVEKVVNEEFLYAGLPGGDAVATTDAEGRFTLRLRAGRRYVLAARAKRDVFGSTEQYYWLVWVSPAGEQPQHVILSNNNLLGQDDQGSVFKLEEMLKIVSDSRQI